MKFKREILKSVLKRVVFVALFIYFSVKVFQSLQDLLSQGEPNTNIYREVLKGGPKIA